VSAVSVAAAPVAALRGITKSFRGAPVLHGVDLEVQAGEAVALLGPNGAGKTTALSILLGLRRPDAGEARLLGRHPRDPAARARLGVTPQASGFPHTLRVDEVARLVATHYRDPVPTCELLGQFGLGALRRRQTGGLSGGEARRLSLALAFAGRPALVVLDEPTGFLDVEARRHAWDGIRSYRDGGGTVLLTSHHLDEVEALASRVVVLAAGRIVATGSVSDVRALAGLTRISLAHSPAGPVPGVARSERLGDGVVLYVADPAAVLCELVTRGACLDGLEVRAASLEEAFLELARRSG
jgi:ABC-2 type transport system ATP-binding protein